MDFIIFSSDRSQKGMSLLGVMITIAIVALGAYALMNAQDQFSQTTRTMEAKESVIQELTNRSAVLQSQDFLRLEETCAIHSLAGSGPGDCSSTATSSTHPFLYRWYNVDAITKICLELTKCEKLAHGKIYVVHVSAHHQTNGKALKTVMTFRKAK